jgi:peptidoglycan/xylan/chitin deacetylase (PgdA/CDA1 family)
MATRRFLACTVAAGVLAFAPNTAAAACPDGALGTARILTVDPAATPRVGKKHFPTTLALGPKEVVLTFDDGPAAGTTERVIEALKRECVRATFFLLGRSADRQPALARRLAAESHTIAHHTYSHPLLNRMSVEKAEAEINRGIAAVETVVYGKTGRSPITPFFRFPGFAGSPALLERLERRGIAVFSTDVWASDWNPMTPSAVVAKVLARLEVNGGGMVLFHDTQPHTARMLPQFLRELKQRDYRVVHVVPAAIRASLAP